MNSQTVPEFWRAYRALGRDVRAQARKAFRLWSDNPFHPSLRFKCINSAENIWAVRITLSYRALGVLEDDTVTWFWIGNHDDYQRFFSA